MQKAGDADTMPGTDSHRRGFTAFDGSDLANRRDRYQRRETLARSGASASEVESLSPAVLKGQGEIKFDHQVRGAIGTPSPVRYRTTLGGGNDFCHNRFTSIDFKPYPKLTNCFV